MPETLTYESKYNNLSSEIKDSKKTAKELKSQAEDQANRQRAKLFSLITRLTVASFIFLVLVITFKIIWKIHHPEYAVISDTVINVLAVGVFAELVGVVGIIAKLLWK